MRTPEPIVSREKIRSPRRCGAFGGVAGCAALRVVGRARHRRGLVEVAGRRHVVTVRWWPGRIRQPVARRPPETGDGWAAGAAHPSGESWERGGQAAEIWSTAVVELLAEIVGDRRRAGGVGGGLLALGRVHVVHERLHQIGGGLVVVLQADDVVADQRDRVRARLGGVAGQVEADSRTRRSPGSARRRPRSWRPPRGCRERTVAHAHGHGAEIADLGGIGVADRAVAGLDGLHHAGGALGTLAAVLGRPGLDRTGGPHVGGHGAEVVGEVLGRARLVRAVDRVDRLCPAGRRRGCRRRWPDRSSW